MYIITINISISFIIPLVTIIKFKYEGNKMKNKTILSGVRNNGRSDKT